MNPSHVVAAAPLSLPPAALPGSARPPGRMAWRGSPETLHPALWLGHQLARGADRALPSGFAALDAQLPGGGWPRGALTELLLPHPGVGEIRLLAKVLAAIQRAGRLVMLFDPPEELSAIALAQLGIEVPQLLLIRTRGVDGLAPPGHLWALEQALKSGHVGAVLAWLPPRIRGDQLRRLQLAAHAHDGPAFLLREAAAQQRPSAAPLRLALQPGGADTLALRVLKRRGPPLESTLRLALQPVLSAAALRRRLTLRTGEDLQPANLRRQTPADADAVAAAIAVTTAAAHASAAAPSTPSTPSTPSAPSAPLPAATFVNLAA